MKTMTDEYKAMKDAAVHEITVDHIATIHKLEFRAMGCQMLAALDEPSRKANTRLSSVPVWFEDWEQALSRFRDDSELSKINRTSGVPQRVSLTFWKVLQEARQAERLSSGLVTPLVLDALEMAGYNTSFENLAVSEPETAITQSRVNRYFSLSEVESDSPHRQVCLPEGAHLDFGGVAKGWAAHQAMKRLSVYGPALVDAGGDIAISGVQRDGARWAVAVADPINPQRNLGILMLGKNGVATSGVDFRRWQRNGHWQHHIIDPRTGAPAETDILSATVVAPDVMQAETAAKTVVILGSQDGMQWLDRQPEMEGILVSADGSLLESHNINKYLWS